MVYTCTDNIDFVPTLGTQYLGNLSPAVRNTMTQTNRIHLAVLNCRPGIHRVRIPVVEQNRVSLTILSYIFAKIQHGEYAPLSIHNPTNAKCITDTLIHPILKWNINIVLPGFKAAYACRIEHIVCTFKASSAIHRRDNFRRQFIAPNVLLTKLRNHIKIAFTDIGKRKMGVL